MKLPPLPPLNLSQIPARFLAPSAFVAAGLISALVAYGAVVLVEGISTRAVKSALLTQGITYASVAADGLQIHLSGTAPNEAARYRVVNLVGGVIDSSRIRDRMEVTPIKAIEAPRFSVEMLRNDDGIQLIGLLPESDTLQGVKDTAQALSPDIPLSDMLETAAYPAPEGWDAALTYGLNALSMLPRSKISVAADQVAITAIASSDAEKRSFETQLNSAKPQGLSVKIEISAPRPVLTPFTLRFVKDAEGARFDACSADTDLARVKILAAAGAAGAVGRNSCTVGLGVPSPRWADATIAGIKAVAELQSATLTFADADVTLLAGADVPQADFDRVVGELGAALPDVFSLKATLEKKATGGVAGPAEFTAKLAPETRRLEMRGRLTDETLRKAVDSFARAEFGSNIYLATRMDADLPTGWPLRVLAGLQAMGELDNGTLLVRADTVELKGITGSQSAKVRISQILSEKLGQGQTFKVDVKYDEALDPLAGIPTPEECAQDVDDVVEQQKITFTPGSAEIDAAASGVMKALADVLKACPGVKLEVAGYTDSQGSEAGNLALSQARAETVVLALQGRQIDISGMVARGYGEADPLVDNTTEAGREINRRIEFRLIGTPKPASPDAAKAAATAAKGSDAAQGTAAAAEGGPDFSGDTSPSVAPQTKTIAPKQRPKKQE
ncbi:MAG: OmpA family protein [Cypionkella sp.]|uniref:OmpA family protein n=1 Tax=Cypionkella sp. TaxID=2811411 RepID=UPI002AB83304|nr:OmpA family protein [Cypionkella sp.]MDZ4310785.1 OmpA family protein [Cypionkella sp.]